MALIHHTLFLGPTDCLTSQKVIATVSTESSYTVMQFPLLEMLGINQQWTDFLYTRDGTQKRHFMAEVKVRLEGRERTTICTFGDAYRQPVLIKHTLRRIRPGRG